MGDVLYIVVPCYNEEAVLPETQKELGNKLGNNDYSWCCFRKEQNYFCRRRIKRQNMGTHRKNITVRIRRIGGVKLAHNRGHQFAVLAGLMTVKRSV